MITIRGLLRQGWKALRLVPQGDYRRGLYRGVAATIEHRVFSFEHDFRTVIDVGAGRGQFALFALHEFPDARLICFEPLTESRERLLQVLPRNRRVSAHGIAVGSAEGEQDLHVSRARDATSLLEMTPAHVAAFPRTEPVKTLHVPVLPLDGVIRSDDLEPPVLLKVDVQGAENEVLKGGQVTLGSVDEVLIEVSFVELYRGQALAAEVIANLAEVGFRLAGVGSSARNSHGQQLQADLHFARDAGTGQHAVG